MSQAGVLAGADPVLDPGVRAVPGLQERQLPAAAVDGEGLVAVAVADLERVQRRTGSSRSVSSGFGDSAAIRVSFPDSL